MKRILLLDDSEISLEMARYVLEDRGHEVVTALNLFQFEERLRTFRPEIILTDMVMPEISGQELVRVLKRDLETERIPVVLFSSKPDHELAAIAEEAGADGYLSKANGIERLGDMVDELVDSILW